MLADPGPRPVDLSNPISDHPLNRGLISWWLPLESKGGGRTLHDLCGRNPGVLTNGPTWGAHRSGIRSVVLDGSDDYIDCGDVPAAEAIPQLTVNAFVRQTTVTVLGGLFTKSAPSSNIDLLNWVDSTNMFARVGADGSYSITSDNRVAAGANQLWSFVFNGDLGSGKLAIYCNGTVCPLSSDACSATTTPANAINATIGKYTYSGQLMTGSVYSVALHKRALSPTEIFRFYEQTARGYPDTLNRYSPKLWQITAPAGSPSTSPGDGTAAGSAVATGVGKSSVKAFGSSAGTGAATGVGKSSVRASGSAAGVGAVVGVAKNVGYGSAAGVGAATGVGKSSVNASGSSAGTGSASGVAKSSVNASGSAAGVGAAAAIAYSYVRGLGTAAGTAVCTGFSQGNGSGFGQADGTAVCTGVGKSSANASGSASGTGSASGSGRSTSRASGTAAGVASAVGIGTTGAVGSAAGTTSASGVAKSYVRGSGTAAGIGAASGVAKSSVGASGSAAGVGAAAGIGKSFVMAFGTAAGTSDGQGFIRDENNPTVASNYGPRLLLFGVT